MVDAILPFHYNQETYEPLCEERSTIAYPCNVYPSRWHSQRPFNRGGGLEVPGCWNRVWWGGRERGAILTNLWLEVPGCWWGGREGGAITNLWLEVPDCWNRVWWGGREGGAILTNLWLEVPDCWNRVWWGGREGGAILTNLWLQWHVPSVVHGYT